MQTEPAQEGSRLSSQSQSKFFGLPAELRNVIYELHLHLQPSPGHLPEGPKALPVIQLKAERPDSKARKVSVLDLLLACRQIHHEAETLFYHLNHLYYSVPGPQLQEPFIRSLRPRRQKALNALTISAFDRKHSLTDALTEIRENIPLATNLRTLHIELPTLCCPTDELARTWAKFARAILRDMKVEEVRILHADTREVKALTSGGFGNNSYVFITERARLARARELSVVVEGILNGVDEA